MAPVRDNPPSCLPVGTAAFIWVAASAAVHAVGYRFADEAGGYGLGGLFEGLAVLTIWMLAALLLPPLAVLAAEARHQRSWRRFTWPAACLLLGLPVAYVLVALAVTFTLWANHLLAIVPLIAAMSALVTCGLRWWMRGTPAPEGEAAPAAAVPWEPWLHGGRRHAPWTVRRAMDLLWFSFVLQGCTLVLVAATSARPGAYVPASVQLLIPAALIVFMARRNGWARWLYLVLLLPGAAASITYPYDRLVAGWVVQLSAMLQLAAQGSALGLLLAAVPSRRWYRTGVTGEPLARQPG